MGERGPPGIGFSNEPDVGCVGLQSIGWCGIHVDGSAGVAVVVERRRHDQIRPAAPTSQTPIKSTGFHETKTKAKTKPMNRGALVTIGTYAVF